MAHGNLIAATKVNIALEKPHECKGFVDIKF